MYFQCLKFSKKPTKKFDKFLPKNLKSGQINKIKALFYNIIIYNYCTTYNYMGYLMYFKEGFCVQFFRPRTRPKTFLQCFALEQRKRGQIKKRRALYTTNQDFILTLLHYSFFNLNPLFISQGRNTNIFIRFLVQMKTLKKSFQN